MVIMQILLLQYLTAALGLLERGDLWLAVAMEKQPRRHNVNVFPQPI